MALHTNADANSAAEPKADKIWTLLSGCSVGRTICAAGTLVSCGPCHQPLEGARHTTEDFSGFCHAWRHTACTCLLNCSLPVQDKRAMQASRNPHVVTNQRSGLMHANLSSILDKEHLLCLSMEGLQLGQSTTATDAVSTIYSS